MKALSKVIAAIVLGIILLALSGIMHAGAEYQPSSKGEAYRAQIEANYTTIEDNTADQDTFGLGVTTYFPSVITGKHPYREAAFLERTGHVLIYFGHTNAKADPDKKFDGPVFDVQGVFMGPDIPFVIKGGFKKERYYYEITPTALSGNFIRETYSIGWGQFLNDNLLMDFEYSRIELELTIEGVLWTTSKENLYLVEAKWVNELADGKAVNINGGIVLHELDEDGDTGENLIFTTEGDFYFNQRISVGGKVALNRGDDEFSEGITIGIRQTTFLHSEFYFDIGFEIFMADHEDIDDKQTITANVGVRF